MQAVRKDAVGMSSEEEALRRPVSPAGVRFRTDVYAETMAVEPVLVPNLWAISVFAKSERMGAVNWTRSDCGDRVRDLMTIEEVGVEVDRIVARTREWGYKGELSVQALPVFTRDGRWAWSGEPLTPGSIAYVAWQRALALVGAS